MTNEQNEKAVDELDHLVRINKDAEAGFEAAAESIRNSELDSLFRGYAKQHHKFAAELQEHIEHLGGKPSTRETLSGKLHRGWMDLKAAASGHSAKGSLVSCDNGEESAEIAYLDAAERYPRGQIYALIQKHQKQIVEFRVHLQRLIGEMKDGVDFQENE